MMTARLLTAAAMALAVAAAPAVAQDRPAAQAVGKVTVVGCVERADQVLSRENLGTTVDSLTFVLVKAQEGKAADQPSPSAGAGDRVGKTYRLDVDVDMINPHVGHRVEITAVLPPNAPIATSGRADAEPVAGTTPPPVLKVESLKQLSSTCAR
jgi:hypothetical protein